MEPLAGVPGLGGPGLSGSHRSNRSSRSWGSSFRQQGVGLQPDTDDPFRRGSASSSRRHDDDEENLRWAALEKLPTYDRMRRAILLSNHQLHEYAGTGTDQGLVEIEHLASGDGGRALLERVFQDDSERFLRRLRDRVDRVGIELPAIEVRYEGLSIEVEAFVGSSALPTLWNVTANFLQAIPGVEKITEGENQELIKELSVPPPGYEDLSFPTKYSQNFYNQCVANFWKQYKSYWKNPPHNAMRYLMTLLNGLVFGTVFWQKGTKLDSQQDLFNLLGATYAAVFFLGAANCITVQPVVAIERTVFYREKAAGMYSPLSYALAQTSVEIIYNIVQGCLYTIVIYSMIGYECKTDKFFYFLFFIISSFNYFTLFGMMLVALTPSAMLANILISFVMPLWNLFAGFLVVRPLIPIWWRWYYWLNPVSWTIYGVVASQFGESTGTLTVPGGNPVSVKQFLDENLGIKHDFLGYIVLGHFAFVIAFFFVFGYSIKVLNFQKR